MSRARMLTLGLAAVAALSLTSCAAGAGAPGTPTPAAGVLPFQSTPPAGDSMGKNDSMSPAGSMSTPEAKGTPEPMGMGTPESMGAPGAIPTATPTSTAVPMSKDGSMMKEPTKSGDSMMTAPTPMTDDSMMQPTPAAGDSMMKEPTPMAGPGGMLQGGSMEKSGSAMMSKLEGRYVDYSAAALEKAAQSGRTVLFFKASWCPTCIASDAAFRANLDKIPSDVTVLKVDYDTATDLKERYKVTSQHSFVQVDAQGNQVTRWDGGGVRELVSTIK